MFCLYNPEIFYEFLASLLESEETRDLRPFSAVDKTYSNEEGQLVMTFKFEKDYIDVIGHPDRLWAPMDHETIVKKTAQLGKIIEINNHSFRDSTAAENCRKIVRLCKKYDVRITLASDAHIAYNVGNFEKAFPVVEQENFPEELIVNRNIEAFEKYLSSRSYRNYK